MPAHTSQNPPPHNPDDHADDDAEFADARLPPPPQVQDINELLKRKNTYAKKRLTMSENLLSNLERRPSKDLRDPDVTLAKDSLHTAQKAIQAANEVVESSNHVLQPEEIEDCLSTLEDHVPRVLDITARINAIHDHVKANVVNQDIALQPTSVAQVNLRKIDNSFKPDPLDEDATPDIFDEWRKQFSVFIRRNGLEQAQIDEQRILLNKCLTPSMAKTLSRVCQADESTTLPEIMKKLESLLLQSNNLITRRFHFFNCVQKSQETIRQYIVRFRGIGDYANFENITYEDLMACRMVTGVKNDKLRRELLRLPKADFDSIQTYATSWEASDVNADQVEPSESRSPSVSKVSTYKSNKKKTFHKNFQSALGPQESTRSSGQSAPTSSSRKQHQSKQEHQPSGSNPGQPPKPCRYCGLSEHYPGGCQAREQRCSYCGIFGHFARVCNKKKYAKQSKSSDQKVRCLEEDRHAVTSSSGSEDNDESSSDLVSTIFKITVPKPSRPTPKFRAYFSFEGRQLGTAWALPDTGAAVSVLPWSRAKSWNLLGNLHKNETPLRSVDGSKVQCSGTIQLTITIEEVNVNVIFFVCDRVPSILVSWHALSDAGIIPDHFPRISAIKLQKVHNANLQCIKKEFITSYPSVFNSDTLLPCMKGEAMQIHLKDSIDWPNVKQTYRPRIIPIPLRQATKMELDSMISKGIIKPVSQPTQFTYPMLVVPKKGNKVRLVVDYTQLNKYIKRPVHPFPSVTEVKSMIPSNAKYFATLDALQGYWQVPLQPKSQLFTTFITPWGRYCYARAPMGLASSGDEFCRRGDIAFKNIPGIIKVVDDLLLYAPTQAQLQSTLTKVMDAARTAGITLSADKFDIGTSVSFLGLNISAEGIRPDIKHLEAISKFPAPHNKTDLRSFLGLVNQFTTFAKSISSISRILRPLLSDSSEWHWTDEHNTAFNQLKQALLQSPVLQYFDYSLPTKLVTNASKLNGLGFALLQNHSGRWALVACGSRFISSTEANYAVCEIEALAIS